MSQSFLQRFSPHKIIAFFGLLSISLGAAAALTGSRLLMDLSGIAICTFGVLICCLLFGALFIVIRDAVRAKPSSRPSETSSPEP